ncbi:tetratricopeptide repeat protein, partial [bacterium]|nr:tetratricopeptide repeat protein [bacterium]
MIYRTIIIAVICMVAIQPDGIASSLEAGHRFYLEGQYSQALGQYSKILTDTVFMEFKSEAMYMSAITYLKIGNHAMALRAFRQLLSEYPNSNWADNACLELARLKEMEDRSKLGESLMLYEMIPVRYSSSE